MRLLTCLPDEAQADRLVAYLSVEAIVSSVDEEDGEWAIWIRDDDDREKAGTILTDFQQNPADPKYDQAERKVRHVLKEAERLNKIQVDRVDKLKKRWSGSWWHCYPATYIMICISMMVAIWCTKLDQVEFGSLGPNLCNNRQSTLFQKMGAATPADFIEDNGVRVPRFYFPVPLSKIAWKNWPTQIEVNLEITWASLKRTIRNGEVWRFVTPAFLHFGVLHILFNMMWLKSLGGAIEFSRGTGYFLLLCLFVAVTSNVAQLFWSGPNFGGMSGVVFGLIGYAWIQGRTQPHLGIGLTHQQVVYSILWLLLCMGGAFGSVANAAHLIGFLAGMLVGGRQTLWKKLRSGK